MSPILERNPHMNVTSDLRKQLTGSWRITALSNPVMDRAGVQRLLLYPRWNEIFCSVPPGGNPFYLKLCVPRFGYSAHAAAEHGVGTNCMSWDAQRCLQLKEIVFRRT